MSRPYQLSIAVSYGRLQSAVTPLAPCGRGVFCQTAQILNKQNHPLTLTLSPGEGTDTNSSPVGEESSRMSNSELRMQVRVGIGKKH